MQPRMRCELLARSSFDRGVKSHQLVLRILSSHHYYHVKSHQLVLRILPSHHYYHVKARRLPELSHYLGFRV